MGDRIILTKTTLKGPYTSLQPAVNTLDVTFTAADISDFNQFAGSGDDLLLVWNTHAVNAGTFTLTSVLDSCLRTGDIITYSVGAGEIAAYRIKSEGWRQSTGYVYLQGSAATIKFAVIPL